MSTNKALTIVPKEPSEAEITSLAKRLMPQFPKDLKPDQAAAVARVALAYGLDPFLGELIPYQGHPYLTFDGRIRIADMHDQYDGYDHGPVVGDELQAMRPGKDEVIWKCAVYRKDRSRPTVAYGRAGGPNERNPIAKQDPVTMAQKRAIHRALRAAFPVPIPGEVGRDEDPIDPPVTPAQLKAIHAADDERGVTREQRAAALEATFGVASSKDLTTTQAGLYLDQRATANSEDADWEALTDVTAEREPIPASWRKKLELLANDYIAAGGLGTDYLNRCEQLSGEQGFARLTRDEATEIGGWLRDETRRLRQASGGADDPALEGAMDAAFAESEPTNG